MEQKMDEQIESGIHEREQCYMRIHELEHAIGLLLMAKQRKDDVGKDSTYQEMRAKAWVNAKKVMKEKF